MSSTIIAKVARDSLLDIGLPAVLQNFVKNIKVDCSGYDAWITALSIILVLLFGAGICLFFVAPPQPQPLSDDDPFRTWGTVMMVASVILIIPVIILAGSKQKCVDVREISLAFLNDDLKTMGLLTEPAKLAGLSPAVQQSIVSGVQLKISDKLLSRNANRAMISSYQFDTLDRVLGPRDYYHNSRHRRSW